MTITISDVVERNVAVWLEVLTAVSMKTAILKKAVVAYFRSLDKMTKDGRICHDS
jgi:hypothetical protein